MPKSVFNYNTPIPAEWFNVINGQRLRFDGNPAFPNDLVDGQYYPIRAQDLDPAILAPYAQSLNIVTTNTDQNVVGRKIFTQPITTVTATAFNHAATKGQLDSAISAINTTVALAANVNTSIADLNTQIGNLNSTTVKLTGNQTVSGVKTFNNSPTVPAGSNPGAAINFSQLEAATATLNAAIVAANVVAANLNTATNASITSLNNQNVKLTNDQTIQGLKTFAVAPNIAPGANSASAVNLAQLLGVLPGIIQYGGSHVEFPNGLKIVWGSRNSDGTQGQVFNYGRTFANPPTVIITQNLAQPTTAASVSNVTTTTYQVGGWTPGLLGIIMSLNHYFIAIGY